MPAVTLHGLVADGYVSGNNGMYSTARDGSNLGTANNGTSANCGQLFITPTYYCNELFIAFDTSSLLSTDTINSLVFSMVLNSASWNQTIHVQEIYARDWGTAVETTDWIAGGSLGGLTLVGTLDTTGIVAETRYNFTSQVGAIGSIVKGGVSRYAVACNLLRLGTIPTNGNLLGWYLADAGTPKDPQLFVNYSPAFFSSPFPAYSKTL